MLTDTHTRSISITSSYGPVGLQEVGLEVDLKQVPSDALHCVVNGQDVDSFPVLHVWAGLDTGGAHGRGNWVTGLRGFSEL